MKKYVCLSLQATTIVLFFLFPACLVKPRLTAAMKPNELQAWVSYLASDDMKGRQNGSGEMKEAADWIADRFDRYGLAPPPGQDNYFQEYKLSIGKDMVAQERNVIGYLKGSDPKLSHEYIILSAHFDHIGVGKPMNGDSIYNGANDNASGTAAVIGIAKNLHALKAKPKRSIVFIAFSGEEKGMQGSGYYCSHPLFPLEKTYLNINFELIGHCTILGKNRYFISGPKNSDLDEKLQIYNRNKLWRISGDVENAEGLFFFSDNRSFATLKRYEKIYYGVPAHTFAIHNGEDHVHKPHDEAQFMDYENMAAFINYMSEVVIYLAGLNEKINWTDDAFRHITLYPKKKRP